MQNTQKKGLKKAGVSGREKERDDEQVTERVYFESRLMGVVGISAPQMWTAPQTAAHCWSPLKMFLHFLQPL